MGFGPVSTNTYLLRVEKSEPRARCRYKNGRQNADGSSYFVCTTAARHGHVFCRSLCATLPNARNVSSRLCVVSVPPLVLLGEKYSTFSIVFRFFHDNAARSCAPLCIPRCSCIIPDRNTVSYMYWYSYRLQDFSASGPVMEFLFSNLLLLKKTNVLNYF